MNDNYDILIVGAGAVGASLFLSLSALPIRIGIIEAKPVFLTSNLDQDGRPLALNYASICILHKLGLWSRLKESATPILVVHVSHQNHFGITRLSAAEMNVSALGYVIPASTLADALNAELLRSATFMHSACVSDLYRTSLGWQVNLKTKEATQKITARLIIAADGTNSSIRNLLNIPISTQNYQQSALTSIVTLARAHNYVAYERFTAHGAIAFLPLRNNQVGLVWTAQQNYVHALQQLDKQRLIQCLKENFGYRLGKLLTIDKLNSCPLKQLAVRHPVHERLIFIGNAAHTLHPIAAQGLNLGLLDSACLSEIITTAVHQARDPGEQFFLNRYAEQRVHQQKKIMNFTQKLTYAFSFDFFPLNLVSNMSLFMLDRSPLFKQRLMRQLMGINALPANWVAFDI